MVECGAFMGGEGLGRALGVALALGLGYGEGMRESAWASVGGDAGRVERGGFGAALMLPALCSIYARGIPRPRHAIPRCAPRPRMALAPRSPLPVAHSPPSCYHTVNR